MKYFPLYIFLSATLLFLILQQNNSKIFQGFFTNSQSPDSIAAAERNHEATTFTRLQAPGKVQGATETVELRSRIEEQIVQIAVAEGDWVARGEVLIRLDRDRLAQERDLAQAAKNLAVAKKSRLVNGARETEITTARLVHEAQLMPLWSAERSLERFQKLFEQKAVSRQSVDQLVAKVDSLRSTAAAAKARLETLLLPARVDEVAAADAEIQAAEAQLKIATLNFQRCDVLAPINGRVLKINARLGELTGPSSSTPLILMSNTTQLFVLAEVDEFDALSVQVGQQCEIKTDAQIQKMIAGRVVSIEPIMHPKEVFGQWAAERIDTFSRRIKIAIKSNLDLPVGLPVDVIINSVPTKQNHD